jgi:hypothetical protein
MKIVWLLLNAVGVVAASTSSVSPPPVTAVIFTV